MVIKKCKRNLILNLQVLGIKIKNYINFNLQNKINIYGFDKTTCKKIYNLPTTFIFF